MIEVSRKELRWARFARVCAVRDREAYLVALGQGGRYPRSGRILLPPPRGSAVKVVLKVAA